MINQDPNTLTEAAKAVAPQVAPKGLKVPAQLSQAWESVKFRLNLDAVAAKIGLTAEQMLEIGAYLCIGFFTGFLFRKYFRFLFFLVLLVGLTVFGLDYLHVAPVDWAALRALFGLQQVASVDTVFNTVVAWVRANLAIVLSGTIGFLIGYKVA